MSRHVPTPTDPALVTFGRRVRALRTELGLTQERLAFAVDLNRTYIGSVERAEKNTGLRNIVRIAHALGVDVGDLTRGL